jgi:hypothetical protein
LIDCSLVKTLRTGVAKAGVKLNLSQTTLDDEWKKVLLSYTKKYVLLEPFLLAYLLVTLKEACASAWSDRKRDMKRVGRLNHDYIFKCPAATQVELSRAREIIERDLLHSDEHAKPTCYWLKAGHRKKIPAKAAPVVSPEVVDQAKTAIAWNLVEEDD